VCPLFVAMLRFGRTEAPPVPEKRLKVESGSPREHEDFDSFRRHVRSRHEIAVV
jgi:hypothetical protein